MEWCQGEVAAVTACTNVPFLVWGFLYKEYENEMILRISMCPATCFTSGINNQHSARIYGGRGDIVPLIIKLAVDWAKWAISFMIRKKGKENAVTTE
jgi:hypothetical protein